jgi:hypothetical protein
MNALVRIRSDLSGLQLDARLGRWGTETIVVVLTGYFDESGEHEGDQLKRLTLGGFFAPWPAIEQLTTQWRAALDDEAISEFHMKEFASDEHQFTNWSPDRQRRLDRFVDILCAHAQVFGAFSYVPACGTKRAFKDTYETALNRVFGVAAELCVDRGKGQVVFAQTGEISTEMVGGYFDCMGFGEYLDRWVVARSSGEPALQAAEIVARGMKRLMQDGLITHSFNRILAASGAPGKSIRYWPPEPLGSFASFGLLGLKPREQPPG